MVSGGLDSTLALRLMVDQGLEVVAVNFSTGFCLTDHQRAVGRRDKDPARLRNQALRLGAENHVPVKIVDIADEYLDVLKYPRYGYGKNANPCVDCRIMMMTKARDLMEEIGADFVFTGEVLGQRPKSQHRRALNLIAEESGLTGRLLRPLSARLLAPTRAEEEGLVDRERLKDFHGRNRKPQEALARELGIVDYPQPAGGCCFLTDPNYAVRVFDLFEHERKARIERDDLLLCKVGRHFRVGPHSKVVVGRFEEENAFLANFSGRRPRLEAVGHQGPLVVIDGVVDEEVILAAARLTARYCDGKGEARVIVSYREDDGERRFEVAPYAPDECEAWLLR
jgi:tRNA U34 2-thiouridine synthase MnmA/TrmU